MPSFLLYKISDDYYLKVILYQKGVFVLSSGITLKEALNKIYPFAPVKVTFNEVVLYNDYDSTIEVAPETYGETFPIEVIVPTRVRQFKDYMVDSISIEIVDQHHSIISLFGHSPSAED